MDHDDSPQKGEVKVAEKSLVLTTAIEPRSQPCPSQPSPCILRLWGIEVLEGSVFLSFALSRIFTWYRLVLVNVTNTKIYIYISLSKEYILVLGCVKKINYSFLGKASEHHITLNLTPESRLNVGVHTSLISLSSFWSQSPEWHWRNELIWHFAETSCRYFSYLHREFFDLWIIHVLRKVLGYFNNMLSWHRPEGVYFGLCWLLFFSNPVGIF